MNKVKKYFNTVVRDTLTGGYLYLWMWHLFLLTAAIAVGGMIASFALTFIF